jgi:MtfA peptidase
MLGWVALITLVVVPIWLWIMRRRVALLKKKSGWLSPLSETELEYLRRDLSLWPWVPIELKNRWAYLTRRFLSEKRFESCGGIILEERTKFLIAAQACVPLLVKERQLYPGLLTVLVYPGPFKRPVDQFENQDDQLLEGESFHQGSVVISWPDAQKDLKRLNGKNLILHEFAHQLDLYLADEYWPQAEQWNKILVKEFKKFTLEVENNSSDVLDEYASENEAEFFAVGMEVFFEKPRDLLKRHPAIYAFFRECLGLDPVNWQKR